MAAGSTTPWEIEDFHLQGGSQKIRCKAMPAFAFAMPSFVLSLSPTLQMKIFDFKLEPLYQRGECAVTVPRSCHDAARWIIARRVAGTTASHHVNLNDMFDWAGNGSDDVL